MKRRDFIKGVSAAACAVTLLPAAGSLMTGCDRPVSIEKPILEGWDFDEVLDRSGTWSIKYGRASEGQIPMWIADMDFRTVLPKHHPLGKRDAPMAGRKRMGRLLPSRPKLL